MPSTHPARPALFALFVFATVLPAAALADGPRRCVRIEAFIRDDSDQSRAAAEFLTKLADGRDGLVLELRDVLKDREALRRTHELLKKYEIEKPGLPVVHMCGQLFVGYRDAETTGRQMKELLTITAYTREGCPHCADLKAFMARTLPKYPGFEVTYRDVYKETGARAEMNSMSERYGVALRTLPFVVICNSAEAGYDTDATTGARLEQRLIDATTECPAEDSKEPTDADESPDMSRLTPVSGPTVWLTLTALAAEPEAEPAGDAAGPAVAEKNEELLEETQPVSTTDTDDSADEMPVDGSTDGSTESFDDLPMLEDIPPDELPAAGEASGPVSLPKDEQAEADRSTVELPLIGTVNFRSVGLPAFTLAVGLVDGFNPCAMWVLLFLLSILVNLKDRRKILAVAGTFVLVSGVMYFLCMAALLNIIDFSAGLNSLTFGAIDQPVYRALGLLAVIVGVIHVKDFFAFKKGLSLSIPESAKPGIYARVRKIVTAENVVGAVIGAAVLAVLVNMIELACTAGLPTMYAAVLHAQDLTPWQEYGYLGLYNLAYMFDDGLMVGVVVITLGKTRLQETGGRWLKLLSGAAILALGLVLMLRPDLLG
jgi:glutaredoxin